MIKNTLFRKKCGKKYVLRKSASATDVAKNTF